MLSSLEGSVSEDDLASCVTSEAYTQCPSYLLEKIIPSAGCPCIWIYIIPNIFLKAIYMSEPLKASHLINCTPGEKLCRPG